MNQIDEKLNTQLKIEKDSSKLYDSFIKKIDIPEIKNKIIQIRDDEIEHAKIVSEMISLIKDKPKVSVSKGEEKSIDMRGFIDDYSSLLVMTNIEQYSHTVINIIKKLNMNCIYLSFNKIPKYTKKLLIDYNVDIGKIKFISCVKVPGGDTIVDPENLTELSVTLEKSMKGMKDKFFVVVDTISAFSVYHSTNLIQRFVSSMNPKIGRHGAGVVWIAISDESEKELNDKISPLCDKVIHL